MDALVTLDGSFGEGGGQILRSALSLSLATGRPFRISNIRAGRRKPGLLRQHLTAVKAATAVGCATVEGAAMGSTSLTFEPQACIAGTHHLQVGTAGSTALVIQAVLPALLFADGPTDLVVEGGTHAQSAPPFEFLQDAYIPLLERMGASCEITLERAGFYPAGGGRVRLSVSPITNAQPFELKEPGRRLETEAIAWVSKLATSIAERELSAVSKKLGWPQKSMTVRECQNPIGPGNALILRIVHEHVTAVFSAFGAFNVAAERVAQSACRDARRWMKADVPVGTYLADQLMLPLALGAGGTFRTLPLSPHAKANMAVIGAFLPDPIEVHPVADRIVDVRVRGRS